MQPDPIRLRDRARGRGRGLPRVLIAVATAGGLAAGGYGIASAASPSPSPAPSASTPGASPAAPESDGESGPGHRGFGGMLRGRLAGVGFAAGRITAINGSTVTVTSESGTATTFRTNADTSVHEGRDSTATVASLAVGDQVMVVSQAGSSSSTTRVAVDVIVRRPQLGGTVTAVNDGSVTVRDRQGFTRTIATSSSTRYFTDGTAGTRSAVKVGAVVRAVGSVDSNGTSLDATRVDVLTKQAAGPGGHGWGPGSDRGLGGFGRGPRGGPGAVPPGSQTPGSQTTSPSTSASPSGGVSS